jgi:hypothetical protein
MAGMNELGSDKLYIANGSSAALIYGDFSSQRVGIGTTNPGSRALKVAGDIEAEGTFYGDASGLTGISGDNLGNHTATQNIVLGSSSLSGDGDNEGIYVDEHGDVGIGVTDPMKVMDPGITVLVIHDNISGNTPAVPGMVIGNYGGTAAISLGSDQYEWCGIGWYHPDYMQLLSTKGIRFRLHDDVDNVYFDMDGNVGIGTDDPERKLHIVGDNPRILVEGTTTAGSEINFEHTDDSGTERWSLYKNGTTDDFHFYQGGNKVTIQNSTGNVGIGTTNPGSHKLYVAGSAYASGGWQQSSDRRFKDNVEDIEGALDKVLELHGVTFRWKTEEYKEKGFAEGRHYGVIAQEVEEVLPEVVKEGSEGDKGVSYTELIPILIESIKELKAENDELKRRIEALEVTVR